MSRLNTPRTEADRAPQGWQRHWAGLAARERRMVLLALLVVGLGLLWVLSLGPSLRTLRQAPAQLVALQTQARHMQAMQDEARALSSQVALGQEAALKALRQATERHLGAHARLNVQGQQAQIVLDQAPAQALALWLAEVRANAHVRPSQAQLKRVTETPDSALGSGWSGSLVLSLP